MGKTPSAGKIRASLPLILKAVLLLSVVAIAAILLYNASTRTTAYLNNESSHDDTAVAAETKTPMKSVGGERPILVDLGADRCIPCIKMKPVLEELKKEYKGRLDVVFYDVWKDPTPAEKFRIYGIPTQIFIDETGKELYRHAGYFSKEEILRKWKEFGYDFR